MLYYACNVFMFARKNLNAHFCILLRRRKRNNHLSFIVLSLPCFWPDHTSIEWMDDRSTFRTFQLFSNSIKNNVLYSSKFYSISCLIKVLFVLMDKVFLCLKTIFHRNSDELTKNRNQLIKT